VDDRLDEPATSLDTAAGETLVAHARSTIDSHLRTGSTPDPPDTVNGALTRERGAFVTLEADGRLRGCCGRPESATPLVETVGRVAVEAAVRDPRFAALSSEELPDTCVTVNALGPMVELDGDPADRPAAVSVGRDGLRVSRDGRVGLLLPEVAVERDVDAAGFLALTCEKAGLPRNAWRRPETVVDRFTAERFVERSPGGPVDRDQPKAPD
jgi:AmmeMemoRadiSam system protein A